MQSDTRRSDRIPQKTRAKAGVYVDKFGCSVVFDQRYDPAGKDVILISGNFCILEPWRNGGDYAKDLSIKTFRFLHHCHRGGFRSRIGWFGPLFQEGCAQPAHVVENTLHLKCQRVEQVLRKSWTVAWLLAESQTQGELIAFSQRE
jgi:hypothetical protein